MDEKALQACLHLFKQAAGFLPLVDFNQPLLKSMARGVEGLCRGEYVQRFTSALKSSVGKEIYFFPFAHPLLGQTAATCPPLVLQSEELLLERLNELQITMLAIEGSNADPYTFRTAVEEVVQFQKILGWEVNKAKIEDAFKANFKLRAEIKYYSATAGVDCFGAEEHALLAVSEYTSQLVNPALPSSGLYKSAEHIRADVLNRVRSLMAFTKVVERMNKVETAQVALPMGANHRPDFENIQKIATGEVIIMNCVPDESK